MTLPTFEDHFSQQSTIYALSRPTYPVELFEFLARQSPANDYSMDVGTGNGQAAFMLSKYFKHVVATDPSAEQIAHAVSISNVSYRVAKAEQMAMPNKSVDLITAATAAHWFNHELFYQTARAQLKDGGVLAVWTYSEARITPAIDELMEWFMYTYLYDYWPDGRWYVRNKYTTLPFPFEVCKTPQFFCCMHWDLQQWQGYMRSWSAFNRYQQKHGRDPMQEVQQQLEERWGNANEKLKVEWPLHLKMAIV